MNFQQRAKIWLHCIQQGFVALLPILFFGALALTLVQIPVYFPSFEHAFVFKVAHFIVNATYGLISVFLVASISYQLAQFHYQRLDLPMSPLVIALLSVVTLVSMLYMGGYSQGDLDFGMQHIIHAVIVSVVFTELFVSFQQVISARFSYLEDEVNNQLSTVIRMITPSMVLPLLILLVYYHVFMGEALIERVVLWVLGYIDTESGLSVWQTIKIVLINQMAWFVGIHGSSLISTVSNIVLIPINSENFSGEIINHFAYLGGSGCTLGLVVGLFFSKRNSNQQFARYAFIPSLFNINELVIFGLPIIFNRFLLIPFLFIPVFAVCIAYLCLLLGWVQFSNHEVVWSMPFLLGGYLLADHWSGAALQLFICVMSGFIYWPFLKRYEVHQDQQQAQKIKGMIDELSHPDCDVRLTLKSYSELGIFCRRLAKDLANHEHFELHYQPKVDGQGKVLGAEALLRWHHPVYGELSPAVFIPIAEASNQIHHLGLWVIERSFKDMKLMDRFHGFHSIPIAINVSPIQLIRQNFLFEVKKRIINFGIEPTRIEFEITEGQRLLLNDALIEDLRELASMGVRIAVDDFGMGHTSLHYLKSFPVHSLKIDGEIIKDVADSELVQEIVQSMGQLAHGMNAVMIAEWVEEEAQLEILEKLGCDQYQGRLFSMPLGLAALVAYCVKHQK